MNAPHALLWSGGKDCALALRRARAAGVDVRRLLTFFDAATGRLRFHGTAPEAIDSQAQALDIPLELIPTTWPEMGSRLNACLEQLGSDGFGGVVLGDIHLADVRAWYESRIRAAGLEHVEPLWGADPAALLAEFIREGGRAVVTCVDTERLSREWLGRELDGDFALRIAQAGVDPCGENGEYHTFVYAGLGLAEPVSWTVQAASEEGRFAQLHLGLTRRLSG